MPLGRGPVKTGCDLGHFFSQNLATVDIEIAFYIEVGRLLIDRTKRGGKVEQMCL